ncbi:MAG TPA: roadblock/LC7 domain-containing protein, partial [Gemmatimonadales bacterium]|nr:roadblock/LC7 domain-containing protein [Gemmatimonadales bacterium]
MPPLHDVLTAIARRPDAAGAIVVSDEGLMIDAALPPGLEDEAVAALAATALKSLATFTAALGHGGLREMVIESEHGDVVILPVKAHTHLLVIARRDAELGDLLHDLHTHGP